MNDSQHEVWIVHTLVGAGDDLTLLQLRQLLVYGDRCSDKLSASRLPLIPDISEIQSSDSINCFPVYNYFVRPLQRLFSLSHFQYCLTNNKSHNNRLDPVFSSCKS